MRKVLGLISLFLGLIFLVIGTVAYYSSSVSGEIVTQVDDIVLNVTGFDDEITKSYVLNNGKVLMPGDSGEFTIDIDVSGSTSDVYLNLVFNKKSIPANLNFYLDSNHTILINKYFKLLKIDDTTKEELTVYWYWDGNRSDEVDNEFIGKTLDVEFSLSATQVKYAYMKNGSTSKEAFWSDEYKSKIRTVSFNFLTNNLPFCSNNNLCFDISLEGSDNKVYAYLLDSGYKDENDNILYDLKIESDALIFAPTDLSYFFSDFTNLVSVNFNSLVTINTTDMSYMFNNCLNLKELDLSLFCTDRVNNMSYMFNGCTNLNSINLSSFNTNKVIYMHSMFKNNASLVNLDISNFISNRVANVNSMFYGMTSLELLDMRNFVFEYDLTSNRDNYMDLFKNVNEKSKVIVKNSQEQAFILGLGLSIRPSNWNVNSIVFN